MAAREHYYVVEVGKVGRYSLVGTSQHQVHMYMYSQDVAELPPGADVSFFRVRVQ